MTNEMHSFSGRNSSISRKKKDNLQGRITNILSFYSQSFAFFNIMRQRHIQP